MKCFCTLFFTLLLCTGHCQAAGGGSSGGGGGGGRGGGSSSSSSSSSGRSSSSSSSSGSRGTSSSSRSPTSVPARTKTVSTASASIYGSGLSKYKGPIGAYPAGTRTVYVPQNSNLLLGVAWLVIANDEIEDYDDDSSQNIPLDPSDLPPGCRAINQTLAPDYSDAHNATDAESVSFWSSPKIYNVGNLTIECQPVDITIGEDDSKKKLSGGAIAGIVIGSVVGFLILLVIIAAICN